MNINKTKTALYAGSFDPATFGHLDIINRGAALFDSLIVAIGQNPAKKPLLPVEKRIELLEELCSELPNVTIKSYEGLTVDFARNCGADLLLRGIRNSQDLEAEYQIAYANRTVSGIETLLLPTKPEFAAISSSLIKQLSAANKDITPFAPKAVCQAINQAFNN